MVCGLDNSSWKFCSVDLELCSLLLLRFLVKFIPVFNPFICEFVSREVVQLLGWFSLFSDPFFVNLIQWANKLVSLSLLFRVCSLIYGAQGIPSISINQHYKICKISRARSSSSLLLLFYQIYSLYSIFCYLSLKMIMNTTKAWS